MIILSSKLWKLASLSIFSALVEFASKVHTLMIGDLIVVEIVSVTVDQAKGFKLEYDVQYLRERLKGCLFTGDQTCCTKIIYKIMEP